MDRAGQLVVAILGRMTPEEANSLLRLRRNRAQGLAMVLDVDTFGDEPTQRADRVASTSCAAEILVDNQWRVVVVQRGIDRRRRPGRASSRLGAAA